MSDTPASISRELQEADSALKKLSDQTSWFKAQRDWWRGVLELKLAAAKVADTGPVAKAKEAALVAVTSTELVEVDWLDGAVMTLPDFVKICDAGYDLVNQRYEYYTSHQMTLMARNKNVLVDYNSNKGY